jgi:preprotein translocase subunit SecE
VNRETKRMMQRQGQLTEDGGVATKARPAPKVRPKEQRTTAGEYLRETRAELRQVAWPSRSEVVNYSAIVLVTLIIIGALIFAIDYAASKGFLYLIHR